MRQFVHVRMQQQQQEEMGGWQPDRRIRKLAGCQPRGPLSVATDCSGLDTPVAALEEILGSSARQVHHVFSSEIDPMTRMILLQNFTPDIHYTDVALRAGRRRGEVGMHQPAAEDLPADLHIYCVGFPCQPFSSGGLSAGVEDARGTVWVHIFRFISIRLPRAVILENVPGLTMGKHKKPTTR